MGAIRNRFSVYKCAYMYVHSHIREHMKEYMPDVDELKLDDREAMEFHYFKLHDYDNNNKLDGLELAAAMTHYHHADEGDEEKVHVSLAMRVHSIHVHVYI